MLFTKKEQNWQIEASRVILKSKKRMAVLFLLTLPIFGVLAAQAAGVLPQFIGGKHALMPSVVNDTMFFGSIFVGVIAGLITGVIGAGGGYILTPAMMSFGVKGIMAVGTDQFHLFAKAIMGTTIHKKLGNVNFGLAVWFVLGSFIGVRFGGSVNRALFDINPAMSDAVISLFYVVVLGSLGIIAIRDVMKKDEDPTESKQTRMADLMQSIKIPPYVKFDGKQLSWLPLALSGAVVGFVTAIMGVGGGFLTFPIFVYSFGVSTFTTVGTNILQVIFTTAFSSIIEYAIYGFVFYTVAIGMLLGSLVGVQIGALVTKVMKSAQIKVFYALTIIAGFVNRLFALPQKLNEMGYIKVAGNALYWIDLAGTVIFFVLVSAFSFWILRQFFTKLPELRISDKGVIVNKKKFWIGTAGLMVFFAVLFAGFTPMHTGKSAVMWADEKFNSLTKGSVGVKLERVAEEIKAVAGIGIDAQATVKAGSPDALVYILDKNGINAKTTGDKVNFNGDYQKLATYATQDAKLCFDNRGEDLAAKYNMEPEQVIYMWNAAFTGINKTYLATDGKIANFALEINENAIEPAYNFSGISPSNASSVWFLLSGLLLFYVIYTLWYGFAIMYIFEGFGINEEKVKKE
ncbi:MAG: Sulfite exporter TauE/SafE [Firmicutes bacterium ADurb.Bin193]|nr:MAG: Sulfite exporter TauE/SafE [Firmicutes bacterium ADurb.Bin193]